MSTEITPINDLEGLSLTEFWGGTERGKCLQVTQGALPDSRHPGFIQLTRKQAWRLSVELRKWADEQRPWVAT